MAIRDETRMLLESMNRLFEDHCTKQVADLAETGVFAQSLWDQVAESGVPLAALPEAAGGADAILLIAAILDAAEIRGLAGMAAGYGMAALVEVHNERDLAKAIDAGAAIVGVNNRDLTTFEVTLETSLRLAPQIPPGVLKVSESGIRAARDIERLREAGYQAFLVGEHLMTSADPAQALRELVTA